ncbi:MAG: ligase-associated DNA damage response DEXH box helicase [Alphaproteobacteria bacterium]|nr:ligase-associated DNA damage response DEXH box helicase [Alphaproteobacteria bacterium]
MAESDPSLGYLPAIFADWFRVRGWQIRPYQSAVLAAAQAGHSVLLTAPTGGGKTLAGFLPSLIAVSECRQRRAALHTLYLSPLKALAVDVARNLQQPVAEMNLEVSVEVRTGDTPAAKRQRQRARPPDLLLTTPEQLALLLSYADASILFRGLALVIIDELHALLSGKRGELLALGLARLAGLAPQARLIGLSATIAQPEAALAYLGMAGPALHIDGGKGPLPAVEVLASQARVPWAGHMAMHALPEIYERIRRHRTTLIFVNTRFQAEVIFQALWRLNEDGLAIALHHGSLSVEQRRKVEAAMVAGRLRAVVCTSTLDLGIDWGTVDLVVHVGAPKGLSRLVQRIGRSNHRLEEPSRAVLVPANRFEVLECRAAADAVADGELDAAGQRRGGLDVLAQHILGVACAGPFQAGALFAEIRRAAPYRALERREFDRVLAFVAHGGYALERYERFRRLKTLADGRHAVAHSAVIRQYRLNVGTIVAEPMLAVRLAGGRELGKVEEYFIEQLRVGDTFVFAGEVLRFEGLREMSALVSRAAGADAMVPSYAGGKFPLSTFLAERVRRLLAEPARQGKLPEPVKEWLGFQRWRSSLPRVGELLVETFPRAGKQFLVAYPFEGRLAHQTLGMLLTRRMERRGLRPLGFVASEYALAIWGLKPVPEVAALFAEDMLGDELEEWLVESNLMKRTFRQVAVIAGLIECRHPEEQKSRRQVTFSSDLIYDVLHRYEPDHVLLQATREDAASGLLDLRRVADLLARAQGSVRHVALDRVSPLAVPLMLEIGREPVQGEALEELMGEAAEMLIADATRLL